MSQLDDQSIATERSGMLSQASTVFPPPPTDDILYPQIIKHPRRTGCRKKNLLITAVVVVVVVTVILILSAILAASSQNKETRKIQAEMAISEQQVQGMLDDSGLVTLRFEAEKGVSEETLVIDVKSNFTEILSEDLDVRADFKKEVLLHKVRISYDFHICLVKSIDKEVRPDELKDAIPYVNTIKVNHSMTYVISRSEVPLSVRSDLSTVQFCSNAPVYMMIEDDGGNSTTSDTITVDEIAQKMLSGSVRRRRDTRDSDSHDPGDLAPGGRYYCGGPIGEPTNTYVEMFTCTKRQINCYRRLVNERCDECYHGHYWRTRGCWCPISAIDTCIKMEWNPDYRCCTSSRQLPCRHHECRSDRVPVTLPIPVIKFRIIHDDKDDS